MSGQYFTFGSWDYPGFEILSAPDRQVVARFLQLKGGYRG